MQSHADIDSKYKAIPTYNFYLFRFSLVLSSLTSYTYLEEVAPAFFPIYFDAVQWYSTVMIITHLWLFIRHDARATTFTTFIPRSTGNLKARIYI